MQAAGVLRIDMWETFYLHEMASHEAIIEWTSSAGMKPFIDSIEDAGKKAAFSNEILEIVRKDYLLNKNGKILFPFKRLFVIGYKS